MRAVAPSDDISADVTSAVSGFSFLGSSLPRPFCKVTCFLAHMSLHTFTHPPELSSGPQQPRSDGGDHPLLWVPPAHFAYFSYTHVSPEHPLFTPMLPLLGKDCVLSNFVSPALSIVLDQKIVYVAFRDREMHSI